MDDLATAASLTISQVNHLPVVADFCRRSGPADTINRVVRTCMEVDMGTMVQAMVLDTLSGLSPLYRIPDSSPTRIPDSCWAGHFFLLPSTTRP